MGIIDDVKAVKDLQRIKNNGSKANMSISSITSLIASMPDAKRSLPKDQFEAVYKLFKELRTCSTKMELDIDGYYKTAVDIIRRFNDIAPYEQYSGGNSIEASFFMQEIIENNIEYQIEKRFPEIKELKQQISSLERSKRQIENSVKKMREDLKVVTPEYIDDLRASGQITQQQYDDANNAMETSKAMVAFNNDFIGITDKTIIDIKEQMEKYKAQFLAEQN